MRKGLPGVIDQRIHKQIEEAKEGKVVAVGPAAALVKLVGSATPIPCAYDGRPDVAVGKRVTIQWIKNARKFVITGVYGTSSSGGISPN